MNPRSIRSRDFHYAVIGEGTLSRLLHTELLPACHVPVTDRDRITGAPRPMS
jgi:hypothetical protein